MNRWDCGRISLAALAVGLSIAVALNSASATQNAAKESSPEEKKAMAILLKTDAAAKAVASATYDGVYIPADLLVGRAPRVEGTVWLGGQLPGGGMRVRFDVTVYMPGSEDAKHVTIGGDGKTYYHIDHDAKIMKQSTDPSVVGDDGQTARLIGLMELLHPEPFTEEITGKHAEWIGTAPVDERPCDIIFVQLTAPGVEERWYIAQDDALPRRVDRTRILPNGQRYTTQLIITKLRANPTLKPDKFKAILPEGYTEKSVPAPPPDK